MKQKPEGVNCPRENVSSTYLDLRDLDSSALKVGKLAGRKGFPGSSTLSADTKCVLYLEEDGACFLCGGYTENGRMPTYKGNGEEERGTVYREANVRGCGDR